MAQLTDDERERLIEALHQIEVFVQSPSGSRPEYILPWVDEIRKTLGLDSDA